MNQHQDVVALLSEFKPDPSSKYSPSVQKALFLARRLQERAAQLQTPAERRQQAELDRMLQYPPDKATLAQMTDRGFRAHDPGRAVGHLIHILDVQGIPRFFGPWDRALLKGFQTFGGYAPGIALPLVKEHMHKETANVIIPGEKEILTRHLRARNREGVRMNVNFLGEAILGEGEAEQRLQQYLAALLWPEIEVVSIKISTLYSQISPLAREHTVAVLCDRLERLYRTADQARLTRCDGQVVPKFVYLDMEEYRDKDLTAEAFMRTLERPGMESVSAGLALQSYIPDSYRTLLQIQEWARRRVAGGGGRITIRLVKGANMEMERFEATLRGWPQAPYKSKRETDANFKRMLLEMMKPENLAAMDAGIASHNLFDLAYGLVLATEQKALDRVQFEMLEGMANHQRRALFELWHNVLLYAPACKRENFINAIGYLIRRLDENTGPDNFLRHAFKVKVGSPEWQQLETGFLDAFAGLSTLTDGPRRTQNRQLPVFDAPSALPHSRIPLGNLPDSYVSPPSPLAPHPSPLIPHPSPLTFNNEPDTDFSLPQNSQWASQIVGTWKTRCEGNAPEIPLVISGEEVFDGRAIGQCLDPSRPGVVVGRYRRANEADIRRAVECAAADPDGWRGEGPGQRFDLLGRVAQEIRQARADLMGTALANGGKTLAESDPEVSEAVDFLEFYRATARWWQERPTLHASPRGVVVVVSPWNFPIAIPCGGVAAALAAGNTVLLKPSSDAVLVAWELCQCFWRAGVSKKVLQFVPCPGGSEGNLLIHHPQVNAVILTGGTATAQAMLRTNPGLDLYAETGGKNATIVTSLADRDQAIKHVLHSAFSHSGQKCSATSLLLLEAEVYDDANFRRTLCAAAASLIVGSAWNLETKMGPLIHPPAGDLDNALKVLQPGEEWALKPRPLEGNPNLWSPGIKYGVSPGSYTHMTEFFGPVLGVMRFRKLGEAIGLVNQTGYGLTSGLESLDEREWDYWKEHIHAGNLYINRVTTGAVVLRQPFGGFGKSVFGPGMKAGGPNYVVQFMNMADSAGPLDSGAVSKPTLAHLCEQLRSRAGALGPEGKGQEARIRAAVLSYQQNFQTEFSIPHDHFLLIGQDNFRRYLPVPAMRVRVHPEDTMFELFARVCAAHTVGSRLTVSIPPNFSSAALKLLEELTEPWAGAIEFLEESDEGLAEAVREHQADRVRYAAPDRVPPVVSQAAAEAGVCLVGKPVLQDGRVELLWYLQEQSLSIDYHRYGNLGSRSGEPRAEPL